MWKTVLISTLIAGVATALDCRQKPDKECYISGLSYVSDHHGETLSILLSCSLKSNSGPFDAVSPMVAQKCFKIGDHALHLDNLKKCVDASDECKQAKCLLNENKWILPNEKPDFAAIKASMTKERMFDIDEALKVCTEWAKGKSCEPGAFMKCLAISWMKKAPDSFWEQSDTCAPVREFLKTCSMEEIAA